MGTCQECGYTYEWKMFYNNHMRSVHGVKTTHLRKRLKNDVKTCLEEYYYRVCDRPTLNEIKYLAEELDVEKEAVYWWFVNRRKSKS